MYMNIKEKLQSSRAKFIRLKHIKLLLQVIVLCFVNGELLCAQNQNTKDSPNRKEENNEKEYISFRDRWSFRTNAFDWLLLTPNVGVEFDLGRTIYNNSTLLLNVKGNWKTSQTHKSPLLYNLVDARLEYRNYWRTRIRNQADTMSFKDKLFSRERKKPRTWRAYYLGGYAEADRYTVKLGKTGIQGTSYGVGISAGFGIPLYTFKHGFLDFEFGGNVGFVMAAYDKFSYDRASDSYPVTETKSLHFVPFPVIHDVQVAFVYRFASIKGKYGRRNEKKIEARQAREKEKRDKIEAEKHAKDSINAVRKLEKEAQKLESEKAKAIKESSKKEDRKAVGKKKEKEPETQNVKAESTRKSVIKEGEKEKSEVSVKKEHKERQKKGMKEKKVQVKQKKEEKSKQNKKNNSGAESESTHQ